MTRTWTDRRAAATRRRRISRGLTGLLLGVLGGLAGGVGGDPALAQDAASPAGESQSSGSVENGSVENWANWRGPNFTGASETATPPVTWSESENVRWKIDLPGQGSGSPVTWDDKLFLLAAIETDRAPSGPARRAAPAGRMSRATPTTIHQFVVLCYDRHSGEELWRAVAAEDVPHEGGHPTNTQASASAVTDGKRVIASFGSRGVFAYDLDGNKLWSRDLGQMQTRAGFGEGASPALHKDTVVVPWDHEGQSIVYALEADTGKTIWQQNRDEPTTWATPLVVETGDVTQVVLSGDNRVRSYDLADGKLIWECGGQASNPIPTPLPFQDDVICMTGYRGFAAYSIPLSSRGDVTDSDTITWKRTDAAPYVASPVLWKGQLTFVKSRNPILVAVDAATGKTVIGETRLPRAADFYASPVAAAGHIYFPSREGLTIVLKAGPTLDVVAVNDLGETIDASPALVGNRMYVRGEKHLFCLEQAD